MSIKFRHIQLAVGFATLLIAGLTSNHLISKSQNQQVSANLAQTEILPNNLQSTLVTQQTSKELTKQNSPSQSYKVIDELQNYRYTINPNRVLSPGKLPTANVNFNQADLLTVLVNTRKYYQDHASNDPNVLRPGLLGTQGVTVEDTLKTLDFMISVLKEDIAANRTTRLQNPAFINKHFRVIKWSAYNPQNPQQNKLRITKYAVFTHPGSLTKTSTFNTPLYSLKDSVKDKFYTKYTKQDILSGIYEPGGKEFGKVEPLVYLTRNGLEDSLMQGTILVNLVSGTQAFFNVDRSNEMLYVPKVRPRAQKRYWYFRKVDAIKGYGYKIDAKISIKPGVTFAGDVLNIGLGRIIVMESGEGKNKILRMGVISDTGGAFLPNLGQLDFLAGIFKNQNDFRQYINQLPEYAKTYILVKKGVGSRE
jgi:hypothetical protein